MVDFPRWIWSSLASCTVVALSSVARAEDAPATPPEAHPTYPTLGGHLGIAIPIVTFASTSTVIGDDFVTIGITPGVTVNLSEHWAIDFEMVAQNELLKTPAATTLVVDPGVLYKLPAVVFGLRVATQVGALTNVGLVPLVVVPFKISKRISYFVEGDIPLFLRDDGSHLRPSASFQFQTGVGF